jgi:peptidoglycan/xylan/chitin deacetylase (PgdA/CDA1 family)
MTGRLCTMKTWRVCSGIGAIIIASLLATLPAYSEFLPRKGFVTLQFDDGHEYHYTYIYPLLEFHHFKGTFAFVTEAYEMGIESGQAWMAQEIYSMGHEIQDHTTRLHVGNSYRYPG